jgi:hypothetical protein
MAAKQAIASGLAAVLIPAGAPALAAGQYGPGAGR